MKRINLLILFILVVGIFNIKALDLNSKYAIIYNLNDSEIVYSKSENKRIPIASLTKIMTSIITIEKIDNLNQKVMVPYGTTYGLAEQNAARVGFIEGSYVTYNDLLYAALLPSGADATRAMAILISGSESKFASLMNEKAKKLGMKDTNFVNSSGLDADNHYSTVKDLLVLLKYALNNPKFKKIYETKTYTSSDKNIYMESTINNYGKKAGIDVSFIKGSKTGFTYDAGYCLASEMVLNDVTFLAITAGSTVDGTPHHITDANKIYNYLKSNYSNREILKPNTLILTLKPEYAKESEINFYNDRSFSKFISNSEKIKVDYIYNGREYLFGNETCGTHLGTVDIVYKNRVIDSIDIVLKEDLTFDYQKYLKQYVYLIPLILVPSILIITLIVIHIKRRKKRLNFNY